MTSRRGRRRGARLFAVYAVASLVPVACWAPFCCWATRTRAELRARPGSGAGGRHRGDGGRSGPPRRRPVRRPDRPERERLQSATDLAIFHGSVVRLRLRTSTAPVVLLRRRLRRTAPFRSPTRPSGRARPGRRPHHRRPATVRKSRSGCCSRWSPRAGQSVGVLEVYLPYDAIAARSRPTAARTICRVGAAYRPVRRARRDLLVDHAHPAPPRRRPRAPGPARPADRAAQP